MDKDYLHIFQEWVPGGSVASLLSKFGSFSIEVIQSYIVQTLNGLSYLHDNNIIHRDIKGSNILVNEEGIVKLADFGASKKLKNAAGDMMMSLTVRGTPFFMAPEVYEEKYSSKADIWGIGCVAFQMVTAKPPWKGLGFTNPISLFNHIKKQNGPPQMEHPQEDNFSTRQQMSWIMLQEFVCKCFEQDPLKRPSVKELLKDKLFSATVEGDIDDEVSVQYRGLFSPRTVTSNKNCSPKYVLSPMQQPSGGAHRSTKEIQKGRRETSLLSPPLSKTNARKDSPSIATCATPLTRPQSQNSPSPDTQGWPIWAKTQLEQQKPDNISELMDSLALSEDSGHIDDRQSMERRSSISGSTAFSNLVGLKLLESTERKYMK